MIIFFGNRILCRKPEILLRINGILEAGPRERADAAFLIVFALEDGGAVGFLDENSIVRRMGYANEISRLNNEIEKYRAEYEENTERLNELAVDSGAIERIAREKYLMKKPNEDIYVFEEDIEK